MIGQFSKPILILTIELQKYTQTFVSFKHLQSWSMSSTNHQYLNHQGLITQYKFLILELLKYRTKRHVMLRNYGRLHELQVPLSIKGARLAILGVFSYHFRTFVSRPIAIFNQFSPTSSVLLVRTILTGNKCFRTQPIIQHSPMVYSSI